MQLPVSFCFLWLEIKITKPTSHPTNISFTSELRLAALDTDAHVVTEMMGVGGFTCHLELIVIAIKVPKSP